MLPVAALAGVQALVAGSLFAVPTVAPAIAADIGVEPSALVGAYMAVIFALGILSSPAGGDLVLRLGALRVSQLCLTGCGIALALASQRDRLDVRAGGIAAGLRLSLPKLRPVRIC